MQQGLAKESNNSKLIDYNNNNNVIPSYKFRKCSYNDHA